MAKKTIWVDPVLESAISLIFTAMKPMTAGGDLYFATQLAIAIQTYLLTATASSVDTGTVSGTSAYAGAGTGVAGCYVILPLPLQTAFLATFTKSNTTDDEIADGIADNVDSALTASDAITMATVGVLTPPPPATPISPYGGTGKGTFEGDKSTISSRLKEAFKTMKKMTEGGDEYLAQELAASIGDYLRAGKVSVTLDDPISGSGSGKITIGTQKEVDVSDSEESETNESENNEGGEE